MGIKKHIVTVLLGLAISFTWGYVVNLGKTQNDMTTELAILKTSDKSHKDSIEKLQKSRETLSDYYVTRPEFNRIIEDQKKLLEKIDARLEKLTDKIYTK